MDNILNTSLQILLQTFKECHNFLDVANIPHIVIGGLAVCLHGYKRNSRDVDLLVRRNDCNVIRQVFDSSQYVWNNFRHAYYSPIKVRVDFRYAGEDAGNGKVLLPDPLADRACEIINGLPVIALAHLIETKLACALTGQQKGKPHKKQHYEKHFVDIAKLITVNNLTGSYADNLHNSVRSEFLKLVAKVSGAGGAP